MNTEDKSVTEIPIDPTRAVRRPDAFTIFINHTRFGHTKWDIQMICGQLTLSTDPDHKNIQELGLISMSPVHAKAVHKALGEGIAGYEAEWGKIEELPPSPVPKKNTIKSGISKSSTSKKK